MLDLKDILFFLVVFISNVIQCITGFAGTVLAMPFSLMLEGFGVAKPILNVLGIVVSLGVIGTSYKSLNKREFFRIVVIMLFGMALGAFITRHLAVNADILYKILGVVVIVFMLIGCYHSFSVKGRKKHTNGSNKTSPLLYGVLIASGIVHGMFVCGGPLLIIYAGERLKSREEFRVTVSAVWVVLNTIIMISDIHAGYFKPRLLMLLSICVVILFAALWIGNIIFKHINKKTFMIITYVLMAISGASLLLK